MRLAVNWLQQAAVLGLAAVCLAAAPPPVIDPEATVVQELVVTARLRGPAWWRVSSPTSSVYVMGAPGALPKGMAWDETVTQHRLKGANALITPPVIIAGLGDLFALMGAVKHFKSQGPMEDGLPADLRARFLSDRARLSHDPRAYSQWTPLVAGLQMVSDYRRQARLDAAEPAKTVRRLAQDAGVRVVPAGSYKAVPLVKTLENQTAAAGPPCLADALDEVDAGAGSVRAAADGWARGDVRVALLEERGYEKCLNSLPEGADLARRAMSDTTNTIAAALAKPGHSVAVVNLRTLLARGGVLQQLRARGFKVTKPDEPAD